MTNKERLISLLGFEPANKDAVEGALVDQGVDPAATYDGSLSISIKKGAIEVIKILLSTADTTNENGYAIKFDRAAILKRLGQLEDELGLTGLPTITSKRVW
jgi:hypothetical protein